MAKEPTSSELKGDGHVRKTVRIHDAMYKQIEKASGGNFNRWILALASKELAKDGGTELGELIERGIAGEKLDAMLDEGLVKLMQEKGNEVLSALTNKELTTLAVSRAPKAAAKDYDHDQTKMNLMAAVAKMPNAEDLRGELIKVKGNLNRLSIEYDINISSIKALKDLYVSLSNGVPVFDGVRDLCREIAKKSYELREEDDLRHMVTEGIKLLQLKVTHE